MAEFIVGNSLHGRARKSRLLRRLLWRVDYVLIRLLVGLFRLLPIDAASRAGERVGRWVGPMLKRKTALYRDNLAAAVPELDEPALNALVVEAWGRAGRILAEFPHTETLLREEQRLHIVMREPLEVCRNPGRPCVIVTAHQSNWEVVGVAMARMGIPNATLYTPPTNPYLDRLLLAHRRALNCELVPRDNSARPLLKTLGEGRVAAMVMDRRVDEGGPVQFFGRTKMATTMPARLAQKFNCDLIPAQVERLQGARYRVTFHPPVRPRNPDANEHDRALDVVQQVHEQFEAWIRAEPRDWFCTKRIWPKPTDQRERGGGGPDAGVDRHAA